MVKFRFIALLILLLAGRFAAGQVVATVTFVQQPPPVAADWLKEPQPLRIIINSPTAINNVKVNAIVYKKFSSETVITTDLRNAIPVNLKAGVNTFLGTDLWTANSFSVNFSSINILSGKLKPDQYDFCVNAVGSNGSDLGMKNCTPFTITEYQEPLLTSPYNPAGAAVIPSEVFKAGLIFRWNSVTPNFPGPVMYRFELFELPQNMTELQATNTLPIVSTTTMANEYPLTNGLNLLNQRYQNGVFQYRYVWRVYAYNSITNEPIGKNSGTAKGFSQLSTIVVTLNPASSFTYQPINGQPGGAIEYSEAEPVYPEDQSEISSNDAFAKGILFRWTKVNPKYQGEAQYTLNVYTYSKTMVKSILLTKTINQDTSYKWVIPNYNFEDKIIYWDITSKDKTTGKEIGKKIKNRGLSEFFAFKLKAVTIDEPTIASPAINGKVSYNNSIKGLELKWNPISPAPSDLSVFYQVSVYQLDSKGKASSAALFTTKVKKETKVNWEFSNSISGNFAWVVASVDTFNRPIGKKSGNLKGYSETGKFSLTAFKVDSVEIKDCDGKSKFITNNGLDRTPDNTSLKNKFVKINEFSMLITEYTGSLTSMSGKGNIIVPWLRTPVKVEFENIAVDGSTMKLTKGFVYAVRDEGDEFPLFLKKSNDKAITKESSKKLYDKLKTNNSKFVSSKNLDNSQKEIASTNAATLPMGIDNLLGYTMVISEMKFGPSANALVAVAVLPYSKDNQNDVLSFAATNISFSPSSPAASNATLTLLQDFNVVDPGENSYGIAFKATHNNRPGTFIEWDCKGFKTLKATVYVDFPRSWLTPVKENEDEVLANEKVTGIAVAEITNLNDWLLTLSLNPCSIEGLDGVELSVSNLVIDNSDTRNADNMKFPKEYTGSKKADFRGFYLKNAEVTLPKFYNKSTDSSGISISVDNMIITKQGISGNVTVGSESAPVIALESGTIGDFQASIESVEINIVNKSITKSEVKGKVLLPISKQSGASNAIKYTAGWVAETGKKGSRVQLTIQPDGKINAELLGGADLTLFNTSTITMAYTKSKKRKAKGTTTADVKLNGNININKKLMDKISVDFEMGFQNLGFNYDNSKTKKQFTFNKASFTFASPQKKVSGFPVTFNSVEIVEDLTEATGYIASATLQFGVAVNLDDKVSGSTTLKIQGGIKKEGFAYKPALIAARIETVSIKASLAAVDLDGSLTFYNNDATYGDGFNGNIAAVFKNIGALTAKVQFGSVLQTGAVSRLNYWYAEAGLTLKNPISLVGPLGIKGAGVGAWYHMSASAMPAQNVNTVNDATADSKSTSSGAVFTPNKDVLLGFKITGVFVNINSDKIFNGDATISAEFNASGGINYLSFAGSAYLGASLKERTKAPIQGTLSVKYDFVAEVFDMNVKVDINYPSSGVAMLKTIESATLSVYVNNKEKIGNEPKWSITVGTPAVPNKLYYFSIETWAYFRAGNNLVTNSNFQPKTIEGLKSVSNSFNLTPEPIDPDAVGGKGFDFGIGFNKSANVSLGPFSGGYSIGAEMNLAMAQYDNTSCVTDKLNYWYARGGVAVWATAYLSFKGLCGVDMRAGAQMQAGGPDPLWVKGAIAGRVSLKILFITINFNATVPFTYGTVCKPRRAKAEVADKENVLDDLEMSALVEIGDLAYHSSGKVDRLTPLVVISYFDLDKEFTLESTDNGVKTTRTYKVDMKWYLSNNGGSTYWDQWFWIHRYSTGNSEAYDLGTYWYRSNQLRNQFSYNTTYKSYVTATLKVKNSSGQWEDAKNSKGETIKYTTKTIEFTTHDD